jgi:hypothetical protein
VGYFSTTYFETFSESIASLGLLVSWQAVDAVQTQGGMKLKVIGEACYGVSIEHVGRWADSLG